VSSSTMWFNGVKITASAGYGSVLGSILKLLIVILCIGGGLRWLLSYEATLDVFVGVFFDVAGLLVAAVALGIATWQTVDYLCSRREHRKYVRHNAMLDRAIAERRRQAVEAAKAPAIEPARLVVVTEQMTRSEVEAP
jgi:hypothetical protein